MNKTCKKTAYYSDLSEEEKDDIKTERNWALEGMVLLPNSSGTELYSNHNHRKHRYYGREEVREGTKAELDAYFAPEKKRRKLRARARMEKQAQILENEISQREESLRKIRSDLKEAKNNYLKLCQHIGSSCLHPTLPYRKIVLDIETTGLFSEIDEILQLSILDADTGETLFDEYFKPLFITEWPDAQAINNISPKMVADKPFFAERISEIQKIISTGETAIAYNFKDICEFFNAYGLSLSSVEHYIDLMPLFSEVYGEYSEYFGDYKWQSLKVCAAHYAYDWGKGKIHNSLNDCHAILYCYNKMKEE